MFRFLEIIFRPTQCDSCGKINPPVFKSSRRDGMCLACAEKRDTGYCKVAEGVYAHGKIVRCHWEFQWPLQWPITLKWGRARSKPTTPAPKEES